MADDVAVEALAALQTAVASLLPAAVPVGLTRQLRVSARAVRPLGLGGYVGRHADPDGMLLGRRVAARVDVDVAGGDDSTAQGYAATLAGQILAQSAAEFAQRGIRRIRGVDAASERALAFDVDFEYVQVPSSGSGLITDLALSLFNNVTPYATQLVAQFSAASLPAAPDPLADFVPLTDAGAAPPAAWAADATAIVQTAATAGGPLTLADPEKAGAQLLWRPRGQALDLARLVFEIDFASASPNGVGVVFHRRAADDFLFFLASQANGYHLFGRRSPAGWEAVASAAAGFATGSAHRLQVVSFDGQLSADLDGRRTLSARTTAPAGGEVGLLTHGNGAARFTAGRLMRLT
ncbi:MAG: hypothetical protein U1F50_08225 [Rubrivivax sp.]